MKKLRIRLPKLNSLKSQAVLDWFPYGKPVNHSKYKTVVDDLAKPQDLGARTISKLADVEKAIYETHDRGLQTAHERFDKVTASLLAILGLLLGSIRISQTPMTGVQRCGVVLLLIAIIWAMVERVKVVKATPGDHYLDRLKVTIDNNDDPDQFAQFIAKQYFLAGVLCSIKAKHLHTRLLILSLLGITGVAILALTF